MHAGSKDAWDIHREQVTHMILSLLSTLKFTVQHPLNRNRKFKAILDFIKWQVGSRLVPGDVIFRWIGDTQFIVRPGEHGLTQNIYCGLQEFSDMAYVLHVLDNEDLFIDIGANVGSYTILACGVKKACGICVEPVPQTFIRLRENLRLNGLIDSVRAHNIGLADVEGELFFTADQNTTNHILLNGEDHPNRVKVKVLSLDALVGDEMPSLIKLDVEGFETLVIAGASKTLRKSSLHSVIMEMNGSGPKHGYSEDKLMDTMLSFGFKPFTYDPFVRKLTRFLDGSKSTGNIIFCRNEKYVQARVEDASSIHINGQDF